MASGSPQLTLLRGRQALARAELIARRVAVFYLLSKPDFVILGEQWILPDVGEIQADEIFFVSLDTLLRHRSVPRLHPSHQACQYGSRSDAP